MRAATRRRVIDQQTGPKKRQKVVSAWSNPDRNPPNSLCQRSAQPRTGSDMVAMRWSDWPAGVLTSRAHTNLCVCVGVVSAPLCAARTAPTFECAENDAATTNSRRRGIFHAPSHGLHCSVRSIEHREGKQQQTNCPTPETVCSTGW